MRNKLFVCLVIFAAALAVVPWGSRAYQRDERAERQRDQDRDRQRDHDTNHDGDFAEKDEIRQSYELSRGAQVEVRGINGRVEIETSNGSTAEVHVVRSAKDRADLEFHKIIIEQSADRLVVRGENDRERNREARGRQVRQRVMMKIPRQVDLSASGVNGRVTVGEIDGPVKLSGINGRVEVAQARGYSHISGINGRVEMTVAGLGEQGIQVSGINGGVELRFAEDLNADLNVTGINGNVSTEVANVTIQGKLEKHSFRARIGSGGAPITVSGVNGRVRLSRLGAAG
jgi:hypothetical protein